MMKYIFIAIVVIFGYLSYIQPWLSSLKSITNDDSLNKQLATVAFCEQFDPRSFSKASAVLKGFMMTYSNTFHEPDQVLEKLTRQKKKIMHYLLRIPLRLHNDAKLEYKLENAIHKIDEILENYVTEAHDRHSKYYFSIQ